MTTAARIRLLAPALLAIALLSACAPTSGDSGDAGGSGGDSGGADTSADGGTGGGTEGGTDGGDAAAGGADCSGFTGEDAPFTTAAVLEAPASGAVWGDGSPYTFTVTPEAAADVPQLSFLGLVDGTVVDASSAFLEEQDGNVYSATESSLFNSDFDGQPGIAKLTIISDLTFDGARYDGTTVILGQYCVTFAAVE